MEKPLQTLSLQENVLDDLKKSGFGSELKAIEVFHRKEWQIQAGSHYFDQEESKSREVDIVGFKCEYIKATPNIQITFAIIADVKKSEHPWVVLKSSQPSTFLELDCFFSLFANDRNLPGKLTDFREELFFNMVATRKGWLGYGIHEAFKKPTDKSRWFSAFSSVCKACEARESEGKSQDRFADGMHLTLIQPVVILDGPLFSASISQEGEIDLVEHSEAAVSFRQQSLMLKKGSYIVDVVRLNSLSDYLTLYDTRASKICNRFLEAQQSNQRNS